MKALQVGATWWKSSGALTANQAALRAVYAVCVSNVHTGIEIEDHAYRFIGFDFNPVIGMQASQFIG